MLNTILFDLDGTLLPMDLDEFIQYYFKAITKTMASSFDSKRLIHSIWNGTQAMLENNGQKPMKTYSGIACSKNMVKRSFIRNPTLNVSIKMNFNRSNMFVQK